jgi:autotransporter-associated beta strand protein
MDIRDGEGTLDVVKDGSGTWTLRGTNTFTGSLTAKDGHLAVWNPEKRYTWFRLTAKENGYGCPTYDTTYSVGTNADGTAKAIGSVEWGFLQISEVAVYDAEGVNIAKGILQDDDHLVFREADGYHGLKPGQVGVGRVDTTVTFNGSRAAGNIQPLDNLFDGRDYVLAGRFSCANDIGIKIDNESTWVPIVFRLPASVTNTAVAMDILSGRNRSGIGSYNGRNIKSFRFEGSTDGINWDVLFDDKDDLAIPETVYHWFSEPTAYTHGVRKGKGYAFDDDTGLDVDHHQYAFSAVGASGNGVLDVQGDALTVSGLVVNASLSAGTISNVVFAASGTLDVQNADISVGVPLVLPGDYSQLAGVDNIARWSVTMDGEEYRSRKIVVKDGRLILMPKGIGLSFR